MNPICTKDKREMKTIKNGVMVRSDENNPTWVANGDLVRCKDCGFETIIGLSQFHTVAVDSQSTLEKNNMIYTLKE